MEQMNFHQRRQGSKDLKSLKKLNKQTNFSIHDIIEYSQRNNVISEKEKEKPVVNSEINKLIPEKTKVSSLKDEKKDLPIESRNLKSIIHEKINSVSEKDKNRSLLELIKQPTKELLHNSTIQNKKFSEKPKMQEIKKTEIINKDTVGAPIMNIQNPLDLGMSS